MFRPSGYNPTQNQSEGDAPISSRALPIYRASGVALARGFQTYLPGPFHYEDQTGQIGGAPYYPAPVVAFNSNFDGDVPMREASTYPVPAPWRRKAP